MDMWMDLLKLSPLDVKYCHPEMEGLVGIFRVSWGVQEPCAVC